MNMYIDTNRPDVAVMWLLPGPLHLISGLPSTPRITQLMRMAEPSGLMNGPSGIISTCGPAENTKRSFLKSNLKSENLIKYIF